MQHNLLRELRDGDSAKLMTPNCQLGLFAGVGPSWANIPTHILRVDALQHGPEPQLHPWSCSMASRTVLECAASSNQTGALFQANKRFGATRIS